MDSFRRRAEDQGGESPTVILARIDERVIAMEKHAAVAAEAIKTALDLSNANIKSALDVANSQMQQHFHDDKGNFAEVRARITSENTKIQEKIDWVNQWIFRSMGGLAVLVVLVGWYLGRH